MISKEICIQEYIGELRGRTGDDPLMIVRTLFAFGLLEAIKSVDIRSGDYFISYLQFPIHLLKHITLGDVRSHPI